jgi:hypothetical protein
MHIKHTFKVITNNGTHDITFTTVYLCISATVYSGRTIWTFKSLRGPQTNCEQQKCYFFSRKLYLILSIKGTYVNCYQFITSPATMKSTWLLIVIQSLVLTTFYARSLTCKKRLLTSSYLSVRPTVFLPVLMEQLGSHWMDFHEI